MHEGAEHGLADTAYGHWGGGAAKTGFSPALAEIRVSKIPAITVIARINSKW